MKKLFVKYVMLIAVFITAACSSNQSAEDTAVTEEVIEVEEADKAIGIQVYSVRKALSEDFEGTIKRVADIGYDYIEAYGLGTDGMIMGMTPAEYKRIVSDAGMEINSVHSTYFTADQAETMIEAAKTLGVKYLVIPWMGEEQRADYAATAQAMNEAGAKFKGTGIKLAYHNHDFEFEEVDGKYALEVMLENSDPENLMFQADLYWVTKGGADAVEFVKKYPGRFCSFHIKDAMEGSLDQTTVGTGVVDFESVFAVEGTGMEFFFVEDEREDDPFANITAAYEYLNSAEFIN